MRTKLLRNKSFGVKSFRAKIIKIQSLFHISKSKRSSKKVVSGGKTSSSQRELLPVQISNVNSNY
jgi:hypothetical protein